MWYMQVTFTTPVRLRTLYVLLGRYKDCQWAEGRVQACFLQNYAYFECKGYIFPLKDNLVLTLVSFCDSSVLNIIITNNLIPDLY